MAEQARIYFIHALSPLHAGVGEGLDAINLPTAREQATKYPFLPGSSVKGVLREAAEATFDREDQRVITAFGPPTERAADARGGLVFSDANLLALPVRSHYGTFAWVTCPYVLRRLARDLAETGLTGGEDLDQLRDALTDKAPDAHYYLAPPKRSPGAGAQFESALRAEGTSNMVYLEDLCLAATPSGALGAIAHWLAELLWPTPGATPGTPTKTQAAALSAQKFFAQRLLLVKDDNFGYLTRTATEVRSRVRINPDTGTAAASGPWSEEYLPMETLLHGLVLGRRTRYFQGGRKADDTGRLAQGVEKTEAQSLTALRELLAPGSRLRFGGKSTAGMGRARLEVVWTATTGASS